MPSNNVRSLGWIDDVHLGDRSDLEVMGDSKATRDWSHCMHERWGSHAMDPVARLCCLEDGEVDGVLPLRCSRGQEEPSGEEGQLTNPD